MNAYLQTIRKLGYVLFLSAATLFGQTGLGVVNGTVQDSSGAAVPGAKVKLTETATNVTREAVTNSAGIHYFGGVLLGKYVLTVEASGFKKWEGQFQVQAGQTVTVDPKLEVGELQSTVEVSSAATPIATEGAQISDVKDAKRIHDLPLNGRQVANLFTLTPGVEGGQGATGGGNPRTNGMMVGSTEMLLDGISYVDRFGGGISRVQPGLDTISEYRIETAGSGAQYSRPATISLVTRSGSNEFHGALFETHRNNGAGLVARARQDGNTPAKLIRNEFGGWVGGRIIKNKTFFFFDQEFLRQREQNFAQTAVPTAAMWAGDFSNAIDTSGTKITIYDPNTSSANGTRTPFPNNMIPQARLKTALIDVFKGVSPTPNGPNAAGNPWVENNFSTFYPRIANSRTTTAKIDHVLSTKDNLSGRFTVASQNNALYGGRYGFPPIGVANGTGTGRQDTKVYSALVRETHVFSPGFLNEFQASVHRSNNSSGTLGDAINWADKLTMPNPFGATGWPTICTDAYSMFYYGCWDGDNRNAQQLTQFQIENNVTWVKGRHTLKFGFKGRTEYNNVVELQQAQGSHDFYKDWTAQYDPVGDQAVSFTGSGLASLELGLPTNLRNQYNRGYFYFRQKEIGLYVNDTWKVTPRLTVDLGLRWDYWSPYKEKYDRLVNIDLKTLNKGMQVVFPNNTTIQQIPGVPSGVIASWALRGLTTTSANAIGFPSALTPNVYRNFAPRIGLAYRLGEKWAVRGGYGAYYWPMPLSQILQGSRSNAPLNLRFVNQIATQNGKDFTYALRNAPGPNDVIGRATVDVTSVQGISSASQGFQAMNVDDWKDNMMQQWTFSLEREVMKNTVLKLSYAGNHGSNLQQHVDYNSPESRYNYQARTGLAAQSNADLRRVNPNWNLTGSFGVLGHSGYSNSHSAQIALERRFSSGLAYQIFYAYTHAMTTNDTGGFTSGSASISANVTDGINGGSAAAVPESQEIFGNPNMTFDQRMRLGYTNSSQVPPQRLTWNGIYELPFGKGKKYRGDAGRGLDALIGGWQLGFIGTWNHGFWMGVPSTEFIFKNPALSSDQRLNMTIFGRNQQLWYAGDFDPTLATNVDQAKLTALVPVARGSRAIHPLGPSFDNRLPQTLANGTVLLTSITDNVSWNARNFMLGPPSWNQDLSIFKYLTITERFRMRLSSDFFNAFNHPNNRNPAQTTGLIDLSRQANAPRIIQLGARLEW